MASKALERLKRKLTIETLWIYIVNVLLEEPTYPYDVRRRIQRKFGFTPSTITTYSVIYRMEREGLLSKSEGGVYRVTEEGEKAYREALGYMRRILDLLES